MPPPFLLRRKIFVATLLYNMIIPILDTEDRFIAVFRAGRYEYCVMRNHKIQATYRTCQEAAEHAKRLAGEPHIEPETGVEK